MTEKKLVTVNIGKGIEYAKVADRLKQFREDTTNASIKTTQVQTDTGWIFTTIILADKSDANCKEATGQSFGEIKGAKAFEKLETISVGRALANLGYLASGDIASFEEMEEFQTFKDEKKREKLEEVKTEIEGAKTEDELMEIYKANASEGLGDTLVTLLKAKKEQIKNEDTPSKTK